jgi:hypothetical protein
MFHIYYAGFWVFYQRPGHARINARGGLALPADELELVSLEEVLADDDPRFPWIRNAEAGD